jgi:hypothetical protein
LEKINEGINKLSMENDCQVKILHQTIMTTFQVRSPVISGYGLETVYAITVSLCYVHMHMEINELDLELCNC